LTREVIYECARPSVIPKNSAGVAADYIEIAVRSKAQVHRTLKATATFANKNSKKPASSAVILKHGVVEDEAGHIKMAIQPKSKTGGAIQSPASRWHKHAQKGSSVCVKLQDRIVIERGDVNDVCCLG